MDSGHEGGITRWRFSALTRRIVAFNLIALAILVFGVLYISNTRRGLIDERILSLTTQGQVIASGLAEFATIGPEATDIRENLAIPLMRRLVGPTATRARVFDREGRLVLDTRNILPRNIVTAYRLPPPGQGGGVTRFLQDLYDGFVGALPGRDLPFYVETGEDGLIYDEVRAALTGEAAAEAVRVNEAGELVVSVAVPVQRLEFVLGALLISTEGGDIDQIVRAERIAFLQVALIALLAMLASSLFLSGTIAEPIRRLAAAAESVRRGQSGRERVPDFSYRRDEIGELARSFSAMTDALYNRIDANERFAADVAHEIKNPLTSLRSAVETLARAPDPARETALLAVIQADIRRVDRLVTDISDASRLDAELSRERMEPVAIVSLLDAVAQICAPPEGEPGAYEDGRHVVLEADLGAIGRERLVVDGLGDRLGQVFRNLIENALSFSPPGAAVTVRVTRVDERVRIAVEDEGPGIPDGALDKIFQRFYTSRPADHFGKNSGLGLAIARQIVEVHRGQIHAENREGGGARFVVDLPARVI